MVTAQDCLKAGLKTMEDRHKVYGPANYLEHGRMLKAMFPNGITLNDEIEFSRFVLFVMASTKFCRYAGNIAKGGHPDSIHDLGNYAFILEAFDINNAKPHREDISQ